MLLSEWQGERQPLEDLSRKFVSTYVKARVNNAPPETIFITEFQNAFPVGLVFFTRMDNGRVRGASAPLDQVDVLCALPKSGVYAMNGGEGVSIVRRIPARQWHEGMYTGNTNILINGEQRVARSIPFDVAMNIFADQTDIPLQEGLKQVKKNKALRLSRHYWLDRKGDTISLMRNCTRIGSWVWENGDFYFSAEAKMLSEELKDELGFHANL